MLYPGKVKVKPYKKKKTNYKKNPLKGAKNKGLPDSVTKG